MFFFLSGTSPPFYYPLPFLLDSPTILIELRSQNHGAVEEVIKSRLFVGSRHPSPKPPGAIHPVRVCHKGPQISVILGRPLNGKLGRKGKDP